MTDPVETVLEARDGRQTSIGFDDAFVTIGKRINPTNRKVLTQQLKGGDMTLARRDARRQMEAGAQVIDVNVGFAGADEPIVMPMAVRASMEEVGLAALYRFAQPRGFGGGPHGDQGDGRRSSPNPDLEDKGEASALRRHRHSMPRYF